MKDADRAAACFSEGFNCAQAVLSTFGPRYGLDHVTALGVAGCFGAGMARMGGTCGAVTGAMMAIGLKYGKIRADDNEARDRAYEHVKEFVEQFTTRHGSVVCRELLGCDVSTDAGYQEAKQRELFETVCVTFVRDAAEMIEELLGG